MPKKVDGVSSKAYDDSFRTVEMQCDDAFIHFINYVFNEHYDSTAKVVRLRNEHYAEDEKGFNEIVTDSNCKIVWNGRVDHYHVECESSGYSETILVRLFRYVVETAIDDSVHEHAQLVIRLPRTGLVVLKDKGRPPKEVKIRIITVGGEVSFDAPVICEADYSIDDLFDKKLYLLLPFYMFNLEARMDVYDTDENALNELTELLCGIIERLEKVDETDLSLRSKGVIIKQMELVAKRLNEKRSKVFKKVGDIMGGKVLKMEWLDRFDAAVEGGRKEGRAEGHKEGRKEGQEAHLVRQICVKLRKGKGVHQIAEELEEEEEQIRQICDKAAEFAPDYEEDKVAEAVFGKAV